MNRTASLGAGGRNVDPHSHGKATISRTLMNTPSPIIPFGSHGQEATFSIMQKSVLGEAITRQAVPQVRQLLFQYMENSDDVRDCTEDKDTIEPNSFAPLQFISLSANDNTARRLFPTKSPLLFTRSKRNIFLLSPI